MNCRERFLTAIRHQEPDRVPTFTNLTPQVAEKFGRRWNLPFTPEDSISEHGPNRVGLSALLTTTMSRIPATIEAINQSGMRSRVKIMVGGAPLNDKFALASGADAYAADAGAAVGVAKGLSGRSGLSY